MFATEAADFLPIWSCSVWGLPCPRHYWNGGALLPHLFTLTPALPPEAVCFLWHFPSSAPNRTGLGTLPDVIRHTALRSSDFPLLAWNAGSGRPVRLPTWSLYAMAVGLLIPDYLDVSRSQPFEGPLRCGCSGFAVHWGSVRKSSDSQFRGLRFDT